MRGQCRRGDCPARVQREAVVRQSRRDGGTGVPLLVLKRGFPRAVRSPRGGSVRRKSCQTVTGNRATNALEGCTKKAVFITPLRRCHLQALQKGISSCAAAPTSARSSKIRRFASTPKLVCGVLSLAIQLLEHIADFSDRLNSGANIHLSKCDYPLPAENMPLSNSSAVVR